MKRDIHEPKQPHMAVTVFWAAFVGYVIFFIRSY